MAYDVILDARVEHNRNPFFYPAQTTLRGEVHIQQIASKNIRGQLAQLGGMIPGHQVQVDTKNRKVRIVDRMGLPENAQLLKQMKAAMNTEDMLWQRLGDPEPDQEFNVTADQWPTWLYHIRRMVDHQRLHIVSGKLPLTDEIRKMGVIRLGDPGSVPAKDPKRPWNFLYPDEVPETVEVA